MAKQVTVWVSERGEQCRSEADAHLADASDAIDQFITDNWTGSPNAADGILLFLGNHPEKLTELLQAYMKAKESRQKEVFGS